MKIQSITPPIKLNYRGRKHNQHKKQQLNKDILIDVHNQISNPMQHSTQIRFIRPEFEYSHVLPPVLNNILTQNSSFPVCNLYQTSVSFKARRTVSTDKIDLAERPGDFYICQFNDIPCPACGKKMLSQEKFDMISEELKQLKPEQYLEFLSAYTDYMRPVEESVFNELYELSKKEGNSKDIRTLLVNLRDKKMPLLQKAQMRQINKMKELARTLPPDEKMVLLKKTDNLKKIIRKTNASAPFRRKYMLERISKVKINNSVKYEKLQNIAKSFPTSYDMNSAWIVKYSGKNKKQEDWNSFDIGLRFLSSSISNTDHIIAHDIENNHDDISNYMAMHNACNSIKSNKSFLQWLNEDKTNRIQYIKDYFISVDNLLTQKESSDIKYKKYVQTATDTVYLVSNGEVNFNKAV